MPLVTLRAITVCGSFYALQETRYRGQRRGTRSMTNRHQLNASRRPRERAIPFNSARAIYIIRESSPHISLMSRKDANESSAVTPRLDIITTWCFTRIWKIHAVLSLPGLKMTVLNGRCTLGHVVAQYSVIFVRITQFINLKHFLFIKSVIEHARDKLSAGNLRKITVPYVINFPFCVISLFSGWILRWDAHAAICLKATPR